MSCGAPEDSVGTPPQRSAQLPPPHCPWGLILPCPLLSCPLLSCQSHRGVHGDITSEVSPAATIPHCPRWPRPLLSCRGLSQPRGLCRDITPEVSPADATPQDPWGPRPVFYCPVLSCPVTAPVDAMGTSPQRSAKPLPPHTLVPSWLRRHPPATSHGKTGLPGPPPHPPGLPEGLPYAPPSSSVFLSLPPPLHRHSDLHTESSAKLL